MRTGSTGLFQRGGQPLYSLGPLLTLLCQTCHRGLQFGVLRTKAIIFVDKFLAICIHDANQQINLTDLPKIPPRLVFGWQTIAIECWKVCE